MSSRCYSNETFETNQTKRNPKQCSGHGVSAAKESMHTFLFTTMFMNRRILLISDLLGNSMTLGK